VRISSPSSYTAAPNFSWTICRTHSMKYGAISDDPVADLGLLEALVGSLELGLRTEDRGEIELEAQRLLERCRQAAPPLRGIENLQERLAALR